MVLVNVNKTKYQKAALIHNLREPLKLVTLISLQTWKTKRSDPYKYPRGGKFC